MASNSTEYYRKNPKAKRKKLAYAKKYNKKPSSVKKRVELTRLNREKGTYGNGDGKDVSHTSCGKTVLEKASKNRARNRGKLKCKGKSKK